MIYPLNFEHKIGFDQVRALLKEKCLSTLGKEKVDEVTFSSDFELVNKKMTQVSEFVRIIQEEDEFPNSYFFDVRPSLHRIRIEGMYLDESEMFDLKRSLDTIFQVVRFFNRHTEEEEEASSPYPCRKWNWPGDQNRKAKHACLPLLMQQSS